MIMTEKDGSCDTKQQSDTKPDRLTGIRSPLELKNRESEISLLFSESNLKRSNYVAVYNIMLISLCLMSVDWIYSELLTDPELKKNHLGASVAKFPSKLDDIRRPLVKNLKFQSAQLGRWMQGMDQAFIAWLICFLQTCLVPYSGIKAWRWMRNKQSLTKVADFLGIIAYSCYLLLFMAVPTRIALQPNIAPTAGLIIMLEQTRFLMKTWSYVRETVGHFRFEKTNDSNNADTSKGWLSWQHYFYFLWAPVLLFRPEYPRKKFVRWRVVAGLASQCLLGILFAYFLLIRWVLRPFSQVFTMQKSTFQIWLQSILACMSIWLLSFYCFLHCWLNMFAEMLKFGDCQFYEDWWNSTSVRMGARKWNRIVYNWLYTYIHAEVHNLLVNQQTTSLENSSKSFNISTRLSLNKWLPIVTTLLISGIAHEYILAGALHFFYPSMFVLLYLCMIPVALIRMEVSQVFLPFSIISASVFLLGYSSEWYARRQCQPIYNNWRDFWVPLSFNCKLHEKFSAIT